MIWFIIGFIVLTIIIIGCIILYRFLSKGEQAFIEVSNQYLKNMGKDYTNQEFAGWAFQFYQEVILSIQNENYVFLREVLADDIYNNYLIGIKNAKTRNVKNVVEQMRPAFHKLVSLTRKDDLEVAKVWMKVSYFEYVVDIAPLSSSEPSNVQPERIISGSKDRRLEKEYILTFVKTHTEKESVVCPNCGFVSKIVSNNNCIRCGGTVVNRKYHWVLIGKEELRKAK